MIRRILVFVALLFVIFFAYRRYNKSAADNLLTTIRNLGSGGSSSYITTIDNTTVDNSTTQPASTDNIVLNNLINTLNDTITPKQTPTITQSGGDVARTIITEENLIQGIQVPGISGEVIVSDKPIEILPKITPISRPSTTINSQTTEIKNTIITPQPQLTPAEIEELNKISSMFN